MNYRQFHSCFQNAARRLRITGIFLILFFVTVPNEASANSGKRGFMVSSPNQLETIPSVYLDCQRCDYNHIREVITFIDYVRDQEQADIHLFITSERTGSGGMEYELSYIGRRNFSDMTFSFTHQVGRNMTRSEIRDSLNEVIQMGLAPFMMRTPIADRFRMHYEETEDDHLLSNDVHDPWNNWVFEIYAGRMQLELESNQREFYSRWGFFADRVTPEWKLRFRPFFNYSFTEIDQGDETVSSQRHRHGIDSYAIKSLTDHWSTGFFADYITREDRNLNHRLRLSPGIEYSIFPYSEATRRSIIFRYNLGYSYTDYYDMTIFEKDQEHLMSQRLVARTRYQQPWGAIHAGIIGSHYFHDYTLRRLDTYTRLSIRLTEGLDLSFQTDFDIIQDQLSLRAGDLDLEDILLAQQELATDFSFRAMVAISYTFGSDFSNVVNTRF